MNEWQIAPLSIHHDRSQFTCGHPSPDRFLKDLARQNQDKDVSRTYVLVQVGGSRVYGYYTLAAGQIERSGLPPKIGKKLPKYPVPVAVLGRLAVDESLKGQKFGRLLLGDALDRCVAASDSSPAGLGIYAVFVEAIDAAAITFYKRFGFQPLNDPDKLFLSLSTIRKTRT